MNKIQNPYATALDGLVINDPVSAFFDFCRQREKIRLKRESGAPYPWTDDPIFQQGRFLNIFREDDRGSKAILSFAKDLENDLPMLIHSLFFARWCNRSETLNRISSDMLLHPEKLIQTLKTFDPWCNINAYPVESIYWNGMQHSRLDAATVLFGDIKESLAKIIIESKGDVIKATIQLILFLKCKMIFLFLWLLLIWLGFAQILLTLQVMFQQGLVRSLI